MTQTTYIRLTETLNSLNATHTSNTPKDECLRTLIHTTLRELKSKQTILYMNAQTNQSWHNYKRAVSDLVQSTIIALISRQKALVLDTKAKSNTFKPDVELEALHELLCAIRHTYQHDVNPPVHPKLYDTKELKAYREAHTNYVYIDTVTESDDWFDDIVETKNVTHYRPTKTPTASTYRVTENTAIMFFDRMNPVMTQINEAVINSTTDALRYFILIARLASTLKAPLKTNLATLEAFIVSEFMRDNVRIDLIKERMYDELNAVCTHFLQAQTKM